MTWRTLWETETNDGCAKGEGKVGVTACTLYIHSLSPKGSRTLKRQNKRLCLRIALDGRGERVQTKRKQRRSVLRPNDCGCWLRSEVESRSVVECSMLIMLIRRLAKDRRGRAPAHRKGVLIVCQLDQAVCSGIQRITFPVPTSSSPRTRNSSRSTSYLQSISAT